jgi:hypothetical protein
VVSTQFAGMRHKTSTRLYGNLISENDFIHLYFMIYYWHFYKKLMDVQKRAWKRDGS